MGKIPKKIIISIVLLAALLLILGGYTVFIIREEAWEDSLTEWRQTTPYFGGNRTKHPTDPDSWCFSVERVEIKKLQHFLWEDIRVNEYVENSRTPSVHPVEGNSGEIELGDKVCGKKDRYYDYVYVPQGRVIQA